MTPCVLLLLCAVALAQVTIRDKSTFKRSDYDYTISPRDINGASWNKTTGPMTFSWSIVAGGSAIELMLIWPTFAWVAIGWCENVPFPTAPKFRPVCEVC